MLLQNSISAEVANGLRSLGHFLHDFCNLGPRPRRVIWGEFCLFVYLFGGGGVGRGEGRGGGVGRGLGIVFLDLFRILCCFQPRRGSHVGGPNDMTN